MEEKNSKLQIQPPNKGNLITILSIDGGGIKGIIPGVILAYLESQLQVTLVVLKAIHVYMYFKLQNLFFCTINRFLDHFM